MCNIFLKYFNAKWLKENTFSHKNYKNVLCLLHWPPPNLNDIRWTWFYHWWLFCLLRHVCVQHSAWDCFFSVHSFDLFHYYTILKFWFKRHIHTLSRPDICSEPYSNSDKNTEPRGRFDSVYCVKSMLGSSNERQKSRKKALHFRSMIHLIFALQKSHFEAQWRWGSDF